MKTAKPSTIGNRSEWRAYMVDHMIDGSLFAALENDYAAGLLTTAEFRNVETLIDLHVSDE